MALLLTILPSYAFVLWMSSTANLSLDCGLFIRLSGYTLGQIYGNGVSRVLAFTHPSLQSCREIVPNWLDHSLLLHAPRLCESHAR